jgi:hypothetical protein
MSVHIFHGNKGGVGKSTTAIAFIEYLRGIGGDPLVVDGDRENADVGRRYTGSKCIDLSKDEGWAQLANLVEQYPGRDLVVNLPAAMGNAFAHEAPIFFEAMQMLEDREQEIICYFVMGRTRDSIAQLKDAQEKNPADGKMRWVVVLNTFFGPIEKFGLWQSSKTRAQFLSDGGKEISLPELPDWALVILAEGNDTPRNLLDKGSVSTRAAFSRWLGDSGKQFDKAVVGE